METPSEPLVSVYVATRDRWSLLQRALRSVLSQDHSRLEVLVVDDGSQDSTPAELAAWGAVEPRLRVLRQAVSRGAPAARNTALRAATGEFVTGLDDDDVFQPGRITAFLRAWRASRAADPAPVFLYGVDDIWGAAPSVADSKPKVADARSLCRANGVGNQVFAPRATWAACGGFAEDLPAWQDLDLWLRMLGPSGVGHVVHDARQALDQSAAHGRISRRPRAELALARDLVVARHSQLGSAACFDLYCQMYSRYYGFEPSWDEVRAAARLYPHPRGLWRIMALKWRRRRRQTSQMSQRSQMSQSLAEPLGARGGPRASETFAVHILVDDKFIDMALREFEAAAPGRQRYVLPGKPRELRYIRWPNVEFVRRRRLPALLNQELCRGVVFHSLEDRNLPLLSRLRPGRTVAWLGWGFDYYDRLLGRAFPDGLYLPLTRALVDAHGAHSDSARKSKLPLRERIAQRFGVRPPTLVERLARVDLFCPVLAVEQRLARQLVPEFRAEYADWNYGSAEADYGALPFDATPEVGRDVLVGNSATATNNHLEVFELLARTPAANDRRIIVPLSYGDTWYRDAVLERGRTLFGERFVPLVDYVAPDVYRALLQSAGHVFLGHVRQQAVGNVCIMLLKGARLYVNTQNPVYTWLEDLGVDVAALRPTGAGFAALEGGLEPLSEGARRAQHRAMLERFGEASKRALTARFIAQLLGPPE